MKRSISFRPTLLAIVLATTMPVAHAAVPKDMLVIGKAADPQTLDPAVTMDSDLPVLSATGSVQNGR